MTAGDPLDPARAIVIAREALAGRVQLTAPADARVERQGATFVVTFPIRLAPGERGADWDARVTIDAATGDVLELLGGQ
jgi:hypothetical protein